MKRKLLYIDINGVLLGKADPNDAAIKLANHAEKFLSFCLERYNCFWLTDYCKENKIDPAIALLKGYADEGFLKLAKRIQPTRWETLKTEAINFSSDFYWIDDALLATEKEILKTHNVFDRWIPVDTRKNPDDLILTMSRLK